MGVIRNVAAQTVPQPVTIAVMLSVKIAATIANAVTFMFVRTIPTGMGHSLQNRGKAVTSKGCFSWYQGADSVGASYAHKEEGMENVETMGASPKVAAKPKGKRNRVKINDLKVGVAVAMTHLQSLFNDAHLTLKQLEELKQKLG